MKGPAMPEPMRPDLCIIGAGSGGLTVAAAARAFGASVVLVERGEMGGDCLNYGCIPSKSLIAAARHAEAIRRAPLFGVAAGAPLVDIAMVHEHVRDVIASLAPNDSVERFERMGVEVIRAEASFADARTVVAGGRAISARRFVIATGSRPAVPAIPGLDTVPYLTNESIFDLSANPDHLVIAGGGPIGMELAQAHRRLGARVTVIEMAEPLARDDAELTAIALRNIEREGVTILANTRVERVAHAPGGVAVTARGPDGETVIEGSHLLVAIGRVPNLESLNLDAAGIRHDRRGIAVDEGLRSSNRRVYAIGDVAGGLHFTHVAGYHAGLVVRNAVFGLPVKVNHDIIPWATYTDPEIAHVGLSEKAARERLGDRMKVVRWSFADNDRAHAEREAEGLVKMITDRRGRILGAGIVGPSAGELIALFSLAVSRKLRAADLAGFIAPYPTLSEIARRVGIEYYRDQVSNPWLRRVAALNRLLP
ncbi:MAG TPA: FAD-dependent oxidoreductase [Devosiaceae bacterium]